MPCRFLAARSADGSATAANWKRLQSTARRPRLAGRACRCPDRWGRLPRPERGAPRRRPQGRARLRRRDRRIPRRLGRRDGTAHDAAHRRVDARACCPRAARCSAPGGAARSTIPTGVDMVEATMADMGLDGLIVDRRQRVAERRLQAAHRARPPDRRRARRRSTTTSSAPRSRSGSTPPCRSPPTRSIGSTPPPRATTGSWSSR